MTKLKGILLTQGMHGMISQVEGLAKALEIEFTHHKVELNNFWNLLPPKFTPVSQNVYKKIDHLDFDIIISCGRKISKYIVVTCDSSSMISEAALTGKPVYVAMIPPRRNDKRFNKFRSLFKELNIIKELSEDLTSWNYESLNETYRVASIIKDKIK